MNNVLLAAQLAESSSGSTPAWVTAVIAAGVAATVSLVTFVLAGRRARLDRQRQLFAEAFQAVMEYREYPHIVRRRKADDASVERQRISSVLSEVQAKLNAFQARLRVEDPHVGERYAAVVTETRNVAGRFIRDAWDAPPVADDADVHAPPGFDLSSLEGVDDAFLQEVQDHLGWLPSWLARTLRGDWPWQDRTARARR